MLIFLRIGYDRLYYTSLHSKFFSYKSEIFEGSEVIEDNVRKSDFFFLVSPTVNLAEKEKIHFQHFVLMGCPSVPAKRADIVTLTQLLPN